MEHGETDAQAVRREVLEETGLAVEPGELVGSVLRPAPDGRVYDIHDYRCTLTPAGPSAPSSDALRPGDDASDARWVTAAEYAALPLVDGLTDALTIWSALPH